jgi:hypothetical protein
MLSQIKKRARMSSLTNKDSLFNRTGHVIDRNNPVIRVLVFGRKICLAGAEVDVTGQALVDEYLA